MATSASARFANGELTHKAKPYARAAAPHWQALLPSMDIAHDIIVRYMAF